MPRTWQLVVFLTVIISLTVGLHYYTWARLVRDPMWPPSGKYVGTFLLVSLAVWLVSLMPLLRVLPRKVATPLAWVGFTWMGLLAYLCLILLVGDIAQWIRSLAGSPLDPERRTWLARLVAFASAGLGSAVAIGAMKHALRSPRVKALSVFLERWPTDLTGFRVAQLTDLHIGPTLDGAWLQEVVEKTNALDPDVIAITGDLVDGSVAELFTHVQPLRGLRARHGVFFVTGNHEYYSGADAWLEVLKDLGIRPLRNERLLISPSEQNGFYLAGVDDYHSGSFPGHGPDLKQALAGRDPSFPVVLLAHQPAAVHEAAQHGVDFQLSGHTHGGQVWPWNYLVRLQQPYVEGLHRHPGARTQIYISPGTGFWGPPMRVGTTAEISLIHLHPSSPEMGSR